MIPLIMKNTRINVRSNFRQKRVARERKFEENGSLMPLELGRVMYIPGRKLMGLCVIAKNKPGVLAKISSLMAKAGFNILYVVTNTTPHKISDVATVVLYLDLGKNFDKLDVVVERLKALSVVKDVKTFKPELGCLLADRYHFPLTINGMRAVLMAMPVLEGLIAITQKHEALKAILWHQGVEVGRRVVKSFKELYGIKSYHEFIRILQARAMSLGWFRIHVVHEDPLERKFVLRLYNNWECEIIRSWGPKEKPQSMFIRGILSGMYQEVFNEPFNVIETKCIALGDPYCEFYITQTKSIQ